MEKFKFIDLFCGIGGFHQAMSELGGECVYASDIDEECRRIYKLNYGIEPDGDITKVKEEDIPVHDVLCAGFPCQSFSKAGKRLGFDDPTMGTLFFDILRILKYHQPKYALLENVRNLASHDNGNTWKIIHNALEEAGYNVPKTPKIFSPHYLGIPQHRERVFIMCVRKDIGDVPCFTFNKEDIPECSIDNILQNDDEIENIKKYQLDQKTIDWINLWNEFIQGINNEKLPTFPVWSDHLCHLADEKDPAIRYYYSGMPDWKEFFIRKNHELFINNEEFISQWLEKAKNNEMFFGAKAKLEWQAGQTPNPDIWENIMQIRPSGLRVKQGTYFPALVAITQTPIVGKRKRRLTPRECARLQSFPDSFIIDEQDRQAYKQFGNSVNVTVVKMFAKLLLGN